MRSIYIGISGLFFVTGLILAFENIGFVAPVYIFFSTFNGVLFYPFLLMLLLGMGAGIFLGLAMKGGKKESDYDDADF